MADSEPPPLVAVSVALYLHGLDLDPDSVTRILGLTPTECWTTGDRRTLSSGREIVRRGGLWTFRLTPDDCDLETALGSFIRVLRPKAGMLAKLHGLEDAYVDLFFAKSAASDQDVAHSFNIAPEILSGLAELNLRLQTTVSIAPFRRDNI